MANDVASARPLSRSREAHFGKYRGTVTTNDDPLNAGRLRARIPDVLGDVESPWAWPCGPYAGRGSGHYTIPPAGAGVWIEFEAGDVSKPLWTGCWWSSGDLPVDEDGTAATPDMKILRSEQGLLVRLSDDSESIAISDAGGGNSVHITARDGQIVIRAGSKVIVDAPQIELVDGAPHPLAFGDSLLTYLNQLVMMFNTHVHPGELAAGILPVTPAPPMPPFPQATPSLISTRVKTG
jgi:hypothetical protein